VQAGVLEAEQRGLEEDLGGFEAFRADVEDGAVGEVEGLGFFVWFCFLLFELRLVFAGDDAFLEVAEDLEFALGERRVRRS